MKSFVRLSLFILLASLYSCSENREARLLFECVRSVMTEKPDSALILLDRAENASNSYSHAQKMKYEFLRAKAMNKSNRPFTSDSIMKEVANYYDAHGSINERMEAHYLLGCVYRDLGEAPIAIGCYNDALTVADTTKSECDYATLFRIYGQMAQIFQEQYMPEEQIEALQHSSQYAYKVGDMFSYVKSMELMVNPYYELGDTAKVLEITDKCHDLYLKYQMPDAAASVYPKAIFIYIQRGMLPVADSLIHVFEKESGLFDEDGNIAEGREDYYYIKGLHSLGMNRPKEAEVLFRKLLLSNRSLYAYDGLLKVYRMTQNMDSIMRYSELREKSADKTLHDGQAQAILQAQALYNFNRLEMLAKEKTAAARRAKLIIIATIIAVALVIIISSILLRKSNKRKREKIVKLQNDYTNATLVVQKMRAELAIIESVNDQRLQELQEEKKSAIAELSVKVSEYESKFANMQAKELDVALMHSDIVAVFKKGAIPIPRHEKNTPNVSENDWESLLEQVKLCIPSFYTYIISKHTLTPQELKVCVLTRLNFTNKEIATILGTGTQNIPNAKKRANLKLFIEDTALTLQTNLLNKVSIQ